MTKKNEIESSKIKEAFQVGKVHDAQKIINSFIQYID